jgi:hypothetical protein
VDLFSDMVSKDPTSRPLASQALERVREIELNLSIETRRSRVPAIPDAEYSRRDAEARTHDVEARTRREQATLASSTEQGQMSGSENL